MIRTKTFLPVTFAISLLCVIPQVYGMDAPPAQQPQNAPQAQAQDAVVYISLPLWFVVMGDIKGLQDYFSEQAQDGVSAADIINKLYVSNMVEGGLLHFASVNGHHDMVTFLLEKGATIDNGDRDGLTSLHAACKKGRKKIVKLLLDKGAKIDAITIQHKLMPIHVACHLGHTSIVKELLSRGASINAQSKDCKEPLFYACANGKVETARLLIEQKANICCSGFNLSALHIAATNGHIGIMEMLVTFEIPIDIEADDQLTPLLAACENDQHDAAQWLIEHNANVRHEGIDSYTPLHSACETGNLKTVQLLINHSASVHAETKKNRKTPLYSAAAGGHAKVVEFLLKQGADVNAKTALGTTALETASFRGSLEIVNLLVKNGAIVDHKTFKRACTKNHPSIIWYFINTCNFVFNTIEERQELEGGIELITTYDKNSLIEELRTLKHFALANFLETLWKDDNSHVISAFDDKCVICYDDVEENSLCVKLSCGHAFHEQCLKSVTTKTCPICRQETNVDCDDTSLCKKLFVYKKPVMPASSSASMNDGMEVDNADEDEKTDSNKRKRDKDDEGDQLHKKLKTDTNKQ